MNENFPLNTIENIPPSSGIFTEKDLLDHIFKGSRSPIDQKFLSDTHGGVFKYFDLMMLQAPDPNKPERFFPYVKIGDEYVGLAQLENDPQNLKNYWISFISVDPKFQGKKYASKLVSEIMKYAQQKGFSLQVSSYSDSGYEKLKSALHREADNYGVHLIDIESRI